MRPVPKNLRPDVWRICLRLDTQSQTIADFDDVFELENQSQLHEDCEVASVEIFHRLTKEHSLKQSKNLSNLSIDSDNDSDLESSSPNAFLPSVANISSDLESVLTHFAQTYCLKYSSSNGWVSILKVLFIILKPTNRSELYASFVSFYHRFVATGENIDQCVSIVFRLLLQYHEPKLCSFLDSLKIGPDSYFIPWISSLFSNFVSGDVIPSLWDLYFLKSDPLLGFYIGLLLIVNAKSVLLDQQFHKTTHDGNDSNTETSLPSANDQTLAGKVRNVIINLPKPMCVSDLTSLVDITEVFINNTPISFRSRYLPILFGNAHLESERSVLSDALCMPITIQEVLDAQSMCLQDYGLCNSPTTLPDGSSDLRYLLVDCRPPEQYNAGHLPTAFFLDSSLIMSDPLKFQNAIKFLLSTQERSLAAGSYAVGKHITFLSTGRKEEDQLANIVVAEFLRQNTPYISLIEGGYAALHEVLGAYEVGRSLIGHEPTICLGCIGAKTFISSSISPDIQIHSSCLINEKAKVQAVNSQNVGLLSKFSSAILSTGRSLDQVPKLLKLSSVYSMQAKAPRTHTPTYQPVQNKETKKPVAYRNTSSVFSIDDDYDEDDICEDETETITNSPNRTEQETKSETLPEQQSTWLKRFLKASTQVSPDLDGDYPSRIDGIDSCEVGDLIDTTQWSRRPEVRGVFNTRFLKPNGQLGDPGLLVLAERHLILLRHPTPRLSNQLIHSLSSTLQSVFNKKSPKSSEYSTVHEPTTDFQKHAIVYRSVPLSMVVRITSNRRFPECITFHYCPLDESDMLKLNDQSLFDMKDRLYIYKAGEAVKMVKTAIFTTVSQLDT
ncbi:TBC1 domain family member 23 [Schistosoma japonicum]|uniref:TBC1 domain family member 23 n=1 Tax=Schistosoma japonicum TaxID=6182 RepID=A0A4Z2DRR8_SCHJA|nr:TBC1 domain family member 23 [Schistosoma japonicum]